MKFKVRLRHTFSDFEEIVIEAKDKESAEEDAWATCVGYQTYSNTLCHDETETVSVNEVPE